MRSTRLCSSRALLFTSALAGLATACDIQDRAIGPVGVPERPQLEASPTSVLAPSHGYRKAITAAAIRDHQAAFQVIADQYDGIRSSLNASHDATAESVRARMAEAGFNGRVQPFTFAYGGDITRPGFARVSPNPTTFIPAIDFMTMSYSGSGDVTGQIYNVDLMIPSGGFSTSGCEAADFAGFPAGAIALVQRGMCEYRVKSINAAQAGAIGVIIMNEGNTPEREETLGGTLNAPNVSVPTIGTSFAIGVALASAPSTVRIQVNAAQGTAASSNVIADSPGGNPNSVVVVGANLDGKWGPGINATSGGAAMLEFARVFAAQERTPTSRVRFIWFGANPEGNHGAVHYVEELATEDRDRIRAMLDVQPIGSPNFGRFVLDSDASTYPAGFAPNSALDAASRGIEALFASYFAAAGLPVASSAARGAGLPFRNAGIPFGGLNTGFTQAKTVQETALFGGTAGVAFDPCFDLPCDTFANVSMSALDQMSDAAAHVVLMLSRRNFVQNPLAGN